MLTETGSELTLPARSVAAPVNNWLCPSAETSTGPLTAATPESASAALNVMVTLLLFQPLAFGRGANVSERAGAVLSILIPLTAAEAELPARSWQMPATCSLAPSEASRVGNEGDPGATPDKESTQLKLTVTSLLFHPLAFGAGVANPAMAGAVLSIMTLTVFTVSAFSAKSVPKKAPVVIPSLLTAKEVEALGETVLPTVWAP